MKRIVNVATALLGIIPLFVTAQNVSDKSPSQVIDALVPVAVQAPDPAFVRGEVRGFGMRWGAIVITGQPANVFRAAIVTEPGAGIAKNAVLNFALLGAVQTDVTGQVMIPADRSQIAWCENDTKKRSVLYCFQDLDADGKFETKRPGLLPTLDSLSVNRVGDSQQVTPFAYREAGAQELPRLVLEYVSCPDQVAYKYALQLQRINSDGSNGQSIPGECSAVADQLGTVDGASLYQFGRFKVSIREEGGKKITNLVEGIPAGTLLGHVRADRPLTDAAAAKSFKEDRANMSGDLPFLYFVDNQQLANATVNAGEQIISGEVAHAITGKLTAPLISVGWTGRKEELPVGTPLFGVLMSNQRSADNLDPEIVWCAPDLSGKPNWSTRCIANAPVGKRLVPIFNRFTLDLLSVGTDGRAVVAPLVERQPVDFGQPLYFSVRFDKWEKDKAVLSTKVSFKDDMASYHPLSLRRSPDGSAYLIVGEALVTLRPSGNSSTQALVECDDEIRQGSAALPIDAFAFARELLKK